MPDLTQHQTAVEAVLAYMLEHNEHHAEELVGMGLNIPQVTQVFLHLKKMGLDVANVYTIEQAVSEIKRLRGGMANA